jgi:multimeric flavodoxin WrbA
MVVGEMNHKRVLGIVGSPRRGGNTEILVDRVLDGARAAGALVDKVIVSELEIGPCRGCDACRRTGKRTGKCVQEDDAPGLLDRMRHSGTWVLGTPVYWWGPTAQLKALVDRWYGAVDDLRMKGRRAIVVVAMESTDAATARHTVGMFADSLDHLKTELLATVVAAGVLHKGDVLRHPEILQAAYDAGREAIAGTSGGR